MANIDHSLPIAVDNLAETVVDRGAWTASRLLEKKFFHARFVMAYEASLTKVFIDAWKKYPRKPSTTPAMLYIVFSER